MRHRHRNFDRGEQIQGHTRRALLRRIQRENGEGMGANPLALASLIYDEKLDNLNPQALCAIAGLISAGDMQEDNPQVLDIIKQRINPDGKNNSLEKGFINARSAFDECEKSILKSSKEARVQPKDLTIADSFGGFVSYIWADYNSKNSDGINNFDNMMHSVLKQNVITKFNNQDPLLKAKNDFNRKATEGNIYKILSQSITVLKQIRTIADYALENEEEFPNQMYYRKLRQRVLEAIELMSKEPLNSGV